MKGLKHFITGIAVLALAAGMTALPAAAETLDALSFDPPSSNLWENYGYDYDPDYGQKYYDYLACTDTEYFTDWAEISVISYDEARSTAMDTYEDWRDYYKQNIEDSGYTLTSWSAETKYVNGTEYMVVNTVSYDENYTYYELEYRHTGYNIYYCAVCLDMPYIDDFYTLIDSVVINDVSQGTPIAYDDDSIKIYVNAQRVYPDSDPIIVNGRTLVPIRVIAEELGYNVGWDGSNQTVTMTNGNNQIKLMIGSTALALRSGGYETVIYCDVAPQIINGRTYLPLRIVGESMGAAVDWDANTKSVFVSK